MLILDLWGISYHAVVVFGLSKNLLFESILGRCGIAFHARSFIQFSMGKSTRTEGFRSDEVGKGEVDEDGKEGDEEEGGVGDLAEDKEHEADDDHLQ